MYVSPREFFFSASKYFADRAIFRSPLATGRPTWSRKRAHPKITRVETGKKNVTVFQGVLLSRASTPWAAETGIARSMPSAMPRVFSCRAK